MTSCEDDHFNLKDREQLVNGLGVYRLSRAGNPTQDPTGLSVRTLSSQLYSRYCDEVTFVHG